MKVPEEVFEIGAESVHIQSASKVLVAREIEPVARAPNLSHHVTSPHTVCITTHYTSARALCTTTPSHTCMPHTRKPSEELVVRAHFSDFDRTLAGDSSSPDLGGGRTGEIQIQW